MTLLAIILSVKFASEQVSRQLLSLLCFLIVHKASLTLNPF